MRPTDPRARRIAAQRTRTATNPDPPTPPHRQNRTEPTRDQAHAADDWRHHAACRGHNTDDWFPPSGPTPAHVTAICAACPVRQNCLEYAITAGEQFGIWGGHTIDEIRAIRRTRGIDAYTHPKTHYPKTCGDHGGTTAGARRHYRAGEKPCHACRAAEKRRKQDRRAAAEASL